VSPGSFRRYYYYDAYSRYAYGEAPSSEDVDDAPPVPGGEEPRRG